MVTGREEGTAGSESGRWVGTGESQIGEVKRLGDRDIRAGTGHPAACTLRRGTAVLRFQFFGDPRPFARARFWTTLDHPRPPKPRGLVGLLPRLQAGALAPISAVASGCTSYVSEWMYSRLFGTNWFVQISNAFESICTYV